MYTIEKFAEDLYDLIKVNALSDDQNDDWSILSRKFAEESKKNIHKFIKDKDMEWNGNEIRIGKHIVITVEVR